MLPNPSRRSLCQLVSNQRAVVPIVDTEQVFMLALLDDLAMSEDKNVVGIANGGQTMGDDDCRPPHHERVQRVLHKLLACRIEGGGRLVEEKDARVSDQCARDCHALLLPSAQLASLVATQAGHSVRALADELHGICLDGRSLDLSGRGIFLPVSDVLPDRRRKEDRLLRNQADLGAEMLEIEQLCVDAVDEHLPCCRVVESLDERDNSALPTP
mmetsp:Transcript_26216/g.53433  ORF Transcript_26216/g.53433 Transcript_26216/m.53433 type:complete len:214 (-) Transcript_26216:526-1167(-)